MSLYDGYIPLIADINKFRRDPNLTAQDYVKASDFMSDSSSTINVKNFGALGDGVTDDSIAIRKAFAAANAIGGGTVYFPPGTYLVSADPNTPTNNISCAIRIPNRVQMLGSGMQSTIIKLAASSNCSVLSNYVSKDGVEANAEFIAVRNLKIDGNKASQSSGHGINFTTYPNSSQATNDIDFDTHQLFENVEIYGCKENGFVMTGRSSAILYNVFAYKNDGQGIVPAYDTVLVGCVSGWSGLDGFYTEQSQVKFFCCTSFFSGQVTPSSGAGFTIRIANQGNIMLLGCVAQDNYASGFNIDTCTRVTLNGCNADSNGRGGVATYAGYDLWSSTYCEIMACVALERKPYDSNSYQQNALRIRQNSTNNNIQITHSAYNGAFIGPAVKSDSTSVEGNNIVINAQGSGSSQSVTYASSVTPDPYTGTTKRISLTGPITINATTSHHAGAELAFIFTQDSTGGRVVTWNSQYKLNWTPVTTSGKINTIRFQFDGTNWIQMHGVTGI